ncbi:glycosyltransferase family 32 protein [Tessaracoccus sp. Y1736]
MIESMCKSSGERLSEAYFRLTKPAGEYRYDPRMYGRSFVATDAEGKTKESPKSIPRVIYCFWTGDNPLTPRRAESLNRMRAVNPGLDVVLVTPQNLSDFVKPGAPLHPAYQSLSAVHKSDYLRAYFMHHHGGGYSDVKRPLGPWEGAFERLVASPEHWSIGYRELSKDAVPKLPGRLGWDLKREYARIHGVCAFIMRPGSPLTAQWMQEVESRMDDLSARLSENPGNAFGNNQGYPVEWSYILGQVLCPLLLKYSDRVLLDDTMLLEFSDYR